MFPEALIIVAALCMVLISSVVVLLTGRSRRVDPLEPARRDGRPESELLRRPLRSRLPV